MQHWSRLETLLNTSRRDGIGSLTPGELREFGLLYRQTAADLSTVREDPASRHFAHYLNQLLARAHNTIYSGKKGSALGLARFFLDDYPLIFRETFAYTFTAFAVFMAAAALGLVLTVMRPEFMHDILGPHMVKTIERREMWTHSILTVKPMASSAIMTNNMTVSFITFAYGMTAGAGTFYILFMNGVMLGVIGAACWLSGMSTALWSFVAPHGVLELPAIFIAGGAGLRLGRALLFPGMHSRRDSLAKGGAEAVRLLVGTIPMLVIAGVIEAFLSPTGLPATMKFLFAGGLFLLLAMYLLRPAKAESAPLSPDID